MTIPRVRVLSDVFKHTTYNTTFVSAFKNPTRVFCRVRSIYQALLIRSTLQQTRKNEERQAVLWCSVLSCNVFFFFRCVNLTASSVLLTNLAETTMPKQYIIRGKYPESGPKSCTEFVYSFYAFKNSG